MSKYSDRAKSYHDAIRQVLLGEWDPIGVADVPEAQDEYDSYIGKVYALLIRHEPRYKLVEYLTKLLERAFAEAVKLPQDEQDLLATRLLAELAAEDDFDRALAQLTEELDPDRL